MSVRPFVCEGQKNLEIWLFKKSPFLKVSWCESSNLNPVPWETLFIISMWAVVSLHEYAKIRPYILIALELRRIKYLTSILSFGPRWGVIHCSVRISSWRLLYRLGGEQPEVAEQRDADDWLRTRCSVYIYTRLSRKQVQQRDKARAWKDNHNIIWSTDNLRISMSKVRR